MKKTSIGIIILVIVLLAGWIASQLFTSTITPESIVILEANVTNDFITMKGDFSASAVNYKSYKVDYKDGKLFVRIQGSILNASGVGRFDLTIINKFGKIDEVYVQGSAASDSRLIWPVK
ncbi:hypothetical protein GK047_18440 [Paenibacillus sp. SYP-B3998]|uniref:Uncharacterized protein n=1 Tax=Paenibacillus sp. SYP-B3998 TaxID=2678564 RepID=A0A6G4A0R5_9BACL|nr:hypothetical protein [Paenibacillus sp. SYP-B3998]NEW07982.1 hypothetical protein [Paenibacillus sp. SYP-B3998]